MVWVIVKYVDEDQSYSRYEHVGDTYTARRIGMPPDPFTTNEEGQPWLKLLIEFNPSVYYGLVEVD